MTRIDESSQFYAKEDICFSLWKQYKQTVEYKSGCRFGISKTNKLIIDRENIGFKKIIQEFVNSLKSENDILKKMINRNIGDWIQEWNEIHSLLFKDILTKSKLWRMRRP